MIGIAPITGALLSLFYLLLVHCPSGRARLLTRTRPRHSHPQGGPAERRAARRRAAFWRIAGVRERPEKSLGERHPRRAAAGVECAKDAIALRTRIHGNRSAPC